MLRIKVPGGVLSPEQVRVIGEIASEFANGPIPNPHFGNNFLDLTTRQDVQMHWIKMGDVPEIWRRLEEVGITTVQACGDSRSEEHTSELQSRQYLVCRLLLEKKKNKK